MRWRMTGGVFLALFALGPVHASAAKPPRAIAGRWISDCLPLGKGGRHGLIVRLDVSRGRFDASGQMFARNSCDMPVISFNDKLALERAHEASGHWALRLRFESATMTINNAMVAMIYADGAKCGSATWQTDVPVHVEGQTCDPVSYPSKGDMLVGQARAAQGRLTVLDLSALFGGAPADGIVLPKDVEFRQSPE